MARPKSRGLLYFPHDTSLSNDKKVRMLEGKYPERGYMVFLKLLEFLYKENGYFLDVSDENTMLLLAKDFSLDADSLNDYIETMVGVGLFNKEKFDKYKILTSVRIQETYMTITKRRVDANIVKKYIIDAETLVSDDRNPEDVDKNDTKKRKENININKRKEDDLFLDLIPDSLSKTKGFKTVWGDWITYLRERGAVTDATIKKHVAVLVDEVARIRANPIDTIKEIIHISINSSWRGLFPLKKKASKTPKGKSGGSKYTPHK